MRSVVAVCAALAAVAFASSASAEAPVVLAAADPAAEAPSLSSPQASDAALPPAAVIVPAEAEQAAPLDPPEPTLFAVIDLSTQTMTVSDENGVIASWKISSARGGYRTPTGTYTPHYTARMHYSKQYHWSPMPYSVFFNEGVAVHGTNATGQLGRPASHGCVRAHPKNAKVFYNLVQKHGMQLTRVTVRGKPPYSPVVAEERRRRYAKPVVQPWGGMFGYSQSAYQPKVKRAKKKQYSGAYNAW
ncbi:MAG: L,D-transpeptidase [Hyphomicrobium sp.]|uniref:L,D-transpeptidase n=1 Tax=Hyphomicrobium sp. TaxID=82 RepID=UPI0013289E68|nr:L,D-transpeptidase [Hyphomicrobium sp.]KAB2943665.1 MAG: L,D-transpeptidase [Hyphomicrobium sp.]MBZ0210635.1 L,D-transpeptidase [Hyphomicrobium sp.]